MGRHSDDARRRGVAGWPIVVLVALLVAGGLVTAYLVLTKEDPQAKNPTCTTTALIEIAAGQGSAPGMNAVSRAFNATSPVARSVCLTAEVSMVRTSEAADLLTRSWQNAQTPSPTIWAPDNLGDVDTVAAANGAVIAGLNNTAIATSPVVLAVRGADTDSFGTGSSTMAWTDLVSSPPKMADGKPLSLALPDPRSNRATSYALQSMIAPEQTGSPAPISAATAGSAASTLKSLADRDAGSTAVKSTDEALTALAAGTASYTAVPVVESELAVFNRSSASPLTAIYPAGPTAGDYITSIGVTGDWVDADGREAATSLSSFLGEPAAITALADSDLRVPGVSAQISAPGIDFRNSVVVLPSAGAAVTDAFASAFGLPAQVDPSSSAGTSAPITSDPSTTASPSAAATTADPPNTTSAPSGTADPTGTGTPPTTSTTTGPAPTTGRPSTSTPSTSTPSTSKPSTTKPSTTKPSTTKPSTTTPPAPATPTAVYTLVVDSSISMDNDDAGASRESRVQEALRQRIAEGKGAAIGLWVISTGVADSGYAEVVGTGLLTGKVGTQTRAKALTAAVDGLTPSGDRYSYAAMVAAYQGATSAAVKGVPNRVIAIVNGGDNTPNLPRADVVATIAATAAANPGVTLDVIGIGPSAPAAALSEVATAGGGSFTAVGSASEVATALSALMAG